MKKWILSFVISILFIGNAFSQVKKVNIDIEGDFEIIVKVGEGTVTVSSTGEIIDVDMYGSIEYYTSATTGYSYNCGKIRSIGGTAFEYYTSATTGYSYNCGKLSSGNRVSNSGGITFNLKGGY